MADSNCAVLYARFSPRPDAAESESVERQLELLREWCAQRNIQIRSEHFDKALSGGDRDRPGFYDAIHACKPGDLFLVRDWERFARDRTFAGINIETLQRRRVTVRSITQQGDMPDTLESRLVRGFMLELAEYNRHVAAARTRAAMLRHQASGRAMGKIPPFGWREAAPIMVVGKDGKKRKQRRWEQDLGEQGTIETIAKMEGSNRQVAKRLQEMGIACRGKCWHQNTVKRIRKRLSACATSAG